MATEASQVPAWRKPAFHVLSHMDRKGLERTCRKVGTGPDMLVLAAAIAASIFLIATGCGALCILTLPIAAIAGWLFVLGDTARTYWPEACGEDGAS